MAQVIIIIAGVICAATFIVVTARFGRSGDGSFEQSIKIKSPFGSFRSHTKRHVSPRHPDLPGNKPGSLEAAEPIVSIRPDGVNTTPGYNEAYEEN